MTNASTTPGSDARADEHRVAVIVPVRRDTDALDRLLARLADRSDASNRIDDIVVAAADTDRAVLEQAVAGRARIVESPAGRGVQLNAGAEAASADVLWFLHADAAPAPGSVAAIRAHIASGHDGGWFRFRFAGVDSAGAERLAAMINWRAARGIAYGDQGLFFRRDRFLEWGGFDDTPLFEEVPLVRAAKAAGRFAQVDCDIGVDPRRWQRTGWVRRTLINRGLALAYAAGVPPGRLARWYRRW